MKVSRLSFGNELPRLSRRRTCSPMAGQIDMFIVDGIVTLKGIVDNILAKDRAAPIAGTVKGVRAQVKVDDE